MRQICLFILILPITLFNSCRHPLFQGAETPWIEMEQTACRGQCPEFKVSYYASGTARYEGYSFTPRTGRFYARLSASDIKKLTDLLSSYPLDSFSQSYISLRPDLPTTYIRYLSEGKTRTITDYDNAPLALRKFEKELKEFTETLVWKKNK